MTGDIVLMPLAQITSHKDGGGIRPHWKRESAISIAVPRSAPQAHIGIGARKWRAQREIVELNVSGLILKEK